MRLMTMADGAADDPSPVATDGRRGPAEEAPSFSIVIATRARPRQLGDCLSALDLLDYPRACFEVLVVDDGGPEPLDSTVAPYRGRFDLTLLRQAHGGPAAARNAGAARAVGTFLAFTDDDCQPAPDWLRALAARFGTAPEAMIGGRTVNALPENPFSTASQLLVDYLYEYYNADPAGPRFFASNNLAAPAERFRALGGFNPRFTRTAAEDRELCDRWVQFGEHLTYAPEVVIRHAHCLDLGGFWRQHFNYGHGALGFHRSRAARRQRRSWIEPPSFYVRLAGYPMTRRRTPRAIGLALLLFLSQLANAAGFLAALADRGDGRYADEAQFGQTEGGA